ncbi:MAG: hypothetical protein AB8F74_21850 [Saprospiraceae bacterium]
MSKKNLSLTPFARLILVLLFAAPLAYIGASYYNGEDGIGNIKQLFGMEEKEARHEVETTEDTYDLEKENEQLRKEVKELKEENADLRERLEATRE